jgi:hypothetical protein
MAEKFDYAGAANDADELLQEFGQTGAIRRVVTLPGPNEWTPGETIATDHQVTVALLPVDLQDVGRDVGGTLIKSTDLRALVSPLGLAIEPTTTDAMLVGDHAYTVVRCNQLAPAGVVVLYDMIVSA